MFRRLGSVVVSGILLAATSSAVALAPAQAAGAQRPAGAQVQFGAYVDDMMARPARLSGFERLVRDRVDIASYYYGYGDVFPGPLERRFSDQGRRKVLVSWHLDVDDYAAWAAGHHDDYLAQVAAAASAYPHDLYVRPWAEMNGDWQRFQPTERGEKVYGGTYAEFKAAWRHVVTYMREHGADNLKWVFNPTADVYAETTPVHRIWPGAAYVDVLGIDGFNWGRDSGWGRWHGYSRIFSAMYQRLTGLHPSAPVWICEFGSKEPRVRDGAPVDRRQDKGQWVRRAFSFRGFPRVRAMVYFHARKERDWRVNSSRAALVSLRRSLNRYS